MLFGCKWASALRRFPGCRSHSLREARGHERRARAAVADRSQRCGRRTVAGRAGPRRRALGSRSSLPKNASATSGAASRRHVGGGAGWERCRPAITPRARAGCPLAEVAVEEHHIQAFGDPPLACSSTARLRALYGGCHESRSQNFRNDHPSPADRRPCAASLCAFDRNSRPPPSKPLKGHVPCASFER